MSITTVNKGVFGTVAREMNILDGGHGENYTPELYFPIVGVYEPDSGDSFPLLDGEMKICDAVKFFENYIQNMPASSQTYYGVHVNAVYVYQIRDDLYYYFFSASKIYDNIPFDYMMNGNHSHDSNRDMNAGGMIECGDVDFIYCTDKTETVIGEEQFNEILPFPEAVRIASEKMTDYVDFEITRAELVYKQKSAIGSLNWGETQIPVYPA